MAKPSEMSEFIKARLGRTSSKLVQSFKRFLEERETDFAQLTEFEKGFNYERWIAERCIATVRQLPGKKSSAKATPEQLYTLVAKLEQKLSDKDFEVKQLRKDYSMLDKVHRKLLVDYEKLKTQNQKTVYLNPPAHVLRAMATYGD